MEIRQWVKHHTGSYAPKRAPEDQANLGQDPITGRTLAPTIGRLENPHQPAPDFLSSKILEQGSHAG